jgi:CRP/FNR family transcriptional regulator, cyclic AMP receptor protein
LSTARVAARIRSVTGPTESGALLERESFAALLDAEDWSVLQARGQRRKVARDAVLMYEGDPGERVVVVLAGRVKVTTTGDDGQETLLSIRGPGEILGELSFLDDQPRIGTVTTLEPVEILAIAAGVFGRYLEERPRVALVILRTLSARFRDASRKRVQFRELDTVGRLAARLVELCERYGEVTPEGTIIGLALTQEELGAWTGASHAGVAKAFQTLRELGWIETRRKRIVVRDIDALRHRSS